MLFGAVLRPIGVIETSYTETLDDMLFGAVLRRIGVIETSYTELLMRCCLVQFYVA